MVLLTHHYVFISKNAYLFSIILASHTGQWVM